MPTKICAYGMYGLITPMVKIFAAEGCLPNFERMLKEGTVNQTFPSFPGWTDLPESDSPPLASRIEI